MIRLKAGETSGGSGAGGSPERIFPSTSSGSPPSNGDQPATIR